PRLMRRLNCQGTPTGSKIDVDPRNGRLTSKDVVRSGSDAKCDIDRSMLAQIDNERHLRDILDEANRANASFYPIDPRGLPVFDTSIANPAPPSVDAAMLRSRTASLRTLAENTDGLAMVNSNDLNGSLQRIVADLSSYYLLGYYSSGKLDGKFHA